MMDDKDQILINFDMNCFNRFCLMDTFNDIVNEGKLWMLLMVNRRI